MKPRMESSWLQEQRLRRWKEKKSLHDGNEALVKVNQAAANVLHKEKVGLHTGQLTVWCWMFFCGCAVLTG